MTERCTLAFALIAELAEALGVTAIGKLAGCWERDLDAHWFIAVNGHSAPTPCSKGADVPPFTCYVEWNGWPAALVTPAGGEIVAGSAANEDALIEALRDAITEARP